MAQQAVDAANERLSRPEQIKAFELLPVEWTASTGRSPIGSPRAAVTLGAGRRPGGAGRSRLAAVRGAVAEP
ncbi:hypothetical protein GCM10027062_16180 [Nocardioides hungaricus]